MDDKISDAEIDRLRAVVGMNSDAGFNNSIPSALPAKKPAFSPQPLPVQKQKSAPAPSSVDTELFVKIEEHAAIGSKLAESKGDMKSIADIISLLAKAEKLKSDAIARMEQALDKLDSDMEELEQKLVPPEGLNVPEITSSDDFGSDNLIDLRSELDSLKNELGRINQ